MATRREVRGAVAAGVSSGLETWPRGRREGEAPGEYWLPDRAPAEHRTLRLSSRSELDRGVALLLAAVLLGLCAMGVVDRFSRSRSRVRAYRAACQSNLRQIALACAMYADDNVGLMPDRLEALYPLYADNAKVFSCPSCPSNWRDFGAGQVNADSSSYELVPGLAADLPGDTILAYESGGANHSGDGRNVAFVDCHVEWLREPEFAKRLAEQRRRLAGRQEGPVDPETVP